MYPLMSTSAGSCLQRSSRWQRFPFTLYPSKDSPYLSTSFDAVVVAVIAAAAAVVVVVVPDKRSERVGEREGRGG